MANINEIALAKAEDLPISKNPETGMVISAEGNVLKRFPTTFITDQIAQISSGFQGAIEIADTPTADGIYIPTEAGTYTNAGGLIYAPEGEDEGFKVNFIKTDTTWVKNRFQMPMQEISGLATKEEFNPVKSFIGSISSPSNQLSDNRNFIRKDRSEPDGTFISSINQLSLDYQPISDGTYTISGLGVVGDVNEQYDRVIFKNASGAVVGTVKGHGGQTELSFTTPATATQFAVWVDAGSNVGEDPDNSPYLETVMLNEGSTALPFEEFGAVFDADGLGLAKQSDIPTDYLKEDEILESYSFNKIDPSKIDYTKRYSPNGSSIVNAGANLVAITDWIKVKSGEFYAVNDGVVYSENHRGAYFENYGDTAPIENITFLDPVDGIGKIFKVPSGADRYVLLNVRTNAGHDALDAPTQMEEGEQSTAYRPYEDETIIKQELLPDNGSSGGGVSANLDSASWYKFTEAEDKNDLLKEKAPIFSKSYLLRDKNLSVVNVGTSLTARSDEHCTGHPDANQRPPLMHSHNMASILWDKMKWDNQFYRRYDFPGYFTEEKTGFATTANLPEWDDNIFRNGYTRYNSNDALSGLMLSAIVPIGAFQYNFIYRTDSLGCQQVQVNITQGNGQMQVYDESDSTWKEANGFIFSMYESTPVARDIESLNEKTDNREIVNTASKSNTTYQKRLKMRCKGGAVDSLATEKNITFSKLVTGRFMYWGVEWSLREFMITYINSARGSYRTALRDARGLGRVADNEVWGFKPDLMLFELPIHNDSASFPSTDQSRQSLINATNEYIFNEGYELSFVTRSQSLNGYVPEMIMFSSSVSWNFAPINEDGTLKIARDRAGDYVTSLDYWTAVYQWVLENHTEVGFVNSIQRWIEAGNAIFKNNLKDATIGSGKSGATFTNEGSHWNDTGSKVIAKTLTGLFEFV